LATGKLGGIWLGGGCGPPCRQWRGQEFRGCADARGVGPEARLKFWGDRLAAIFGAEDNMEQVLRVCVDKCRASALGIVIHHVPSPYGLANLWRASGAGNFCGARTQGLRPGLTCFAPPALGIVIHHVPSPYGLG